MLIVFTSRKFKESPYQNKQKQKQKFLISWDIPGVSRLYIKNEPGIYVFMKYAWLDNKKSQ